MGSDEDRLLEAFERATTKLNLCPNRVWAVGRENLAKLIPDRDWIQDEDADEDTDVDVNNGELNGHKSCTFDFCEQSQRDFTAVEQRHECGEKDKCSQLQGLFSRETLDDAANNEKSTVWSLDGRAMIERSQPYMAISHVWSDGTGIGAWQDGQVNECLYHFFEKIAKQFQCDGIWWDTICIPKKKTARIKAIEKIQRNYEDARITLVHDCFLRDWNWDPETACFRILMSPWFSRGWTALELANSRKVKVIFKGPYGLVIKDLDEEILAKAGDPNGPRKEASQIIRNLRHRISSLNSLLTALGPRHTSWPKDRAIIAQLLADIKPQNTSQNATLQQDIYKAILRKLRDVSSGHLFHNSATMSQVSWCPSNLFDMPTTDLGSPLRVTEALDIIGKWKRIPIANIPKERYTWRGIHPLMEVRIKLHLQSQEGHKCLLLFECRTERADKSNTGLIQRALLVREITPKPPRYKYVGAVYFSPAIAEKDFSENIDEIEVILLGDAGRKVEPTENTHAARTWTREQNLNLTLETEGLCDAIWNGHRDRFLLSVKNANQVEPDSLGQLPLHLAAERGDVWMVHCLLIEAERKNVTQIVLGAKCAKGQTPLHRAAWAGSVAVVKLLKDEVNTSIYDNDGNSAFHIAADKGFMGVLDALIDEHNWSAKNKNGETPLHYAARSGYLDIVEKLLTRGADINATDNCGWAPLHYASGTGRPETVKLLLAKGATINIKDNVGWTPLHLAAISDRLGVIIELLDGQAEVDSTDNNGWTPWQFAALKGHLVVMKLLLAKRPSGDFSVVDDILCIQQHDALIKTQERAIKLDAYGYKDVVRIKVDDLELLSWAAKNRQKDLVWLLLDNVAGSKGAKVNVEDTYGQTLLSLGAKHGHKFVVQLLLDKGADVNTHDTSGQTLFSLAAMNGHESIIQLLLEKGAKVNTEDTSSQTPLSLAAINGHESIVQLLLKKGAKVNIEDTSGQTPLSLAAMNGHESVVQLLLEHHAEVDIKDRSGRTPLSLAAMNQRESVMQLLLEHGAKLNAEESVEVINP